MPCASHRPAPPSSPHTLPAGHAFTDEDEPSTLLLLVPLLVWETPDPEPPEDEPDTPLRLEPAALLEPPADDTTTPLLDVLLPAPATQLPDWQL